MCSLLVLNTRGTYLGKKGISVWICSSLTFIAAIHLVEAISVIIFDNQIRLLTLYPLINEKLQAITLPIYFWISAATTLTLWGITCATAFNNPVEAFLNKILSDAKQQGAVETQLLEDKSEVLDAMYDTIVSDNEILAQVKDLMCNVRADVKEIRPVTEGLDKMKTELSSLKREIKRMEERTQSPCLCPTCGKPLLPEFKICPYCGENVKLMPEKIVSLKEYR